MLRSARTGGYTTDGEVGEPRCSPKSMYRLADKLGLEDLKRLAFDAIKRDLEKQNILEEVFSNFTSKYPAVEEMELAVLCAQIKSPEVKAGLPKTMEEFASGKKQFAGKAMGRLVAMLSAY